MPTKKKIDTVKSLKDKLGRAKALFLTDYRGLTHKQLETLRRALKKVEAEFLVAKNRLIKIALGAEEVKNSKENKQKLEEELNNPTAAFLVYGDEISAIKTLAIFIKNTQLPKIKIGIFGGNIATDADFQKLASLPTREILLATLVGSMKSPIYGLYYSLSWNIQRFVRVLGNIKDKKSQ